MKKLNIFLYSALFGVLEGCKKDSSKAEALVPESAPKLDPKVFSADNILDLTKTKAVLRFDDTKGSITVRYDKGDEFRLELTNRHSADTVWRAKKVPRCLEEIHTNGSAKSKPKGQMGEYGYEVHTYKVIGNCIGEKLIWKPERTSGGKVDTNDFIEININRL